MREPVVAEVRVEERGQILTALIILQYQEVAAETVEEPVALTQVPSPPHLVQEEPEGVELEPQMMDNQEVQPRSTA
jgi:hypothetical protein